ncbi:laminin subunit gamma-1-like [Dendronephthya gigantea]|uniref:laminin subunit gamma-1-like n=1 Tax=Dendronephthya gigantea TaxID=151771 RepID=UPI001069F9F7|nr:laminin subunit gamma-1-like [Dendronephthya gigantea]
MAASLWLFFFVNIQLIRPSFAANAAFRKKVQAVPSCGVNKTEMYYHIKQALKLPFQQKPSICDQNLTKYAHPPKALVDGNFTTFWQTEGGKDKANITIDLSGLKQKFYYAKSITIYFGDYFRPDQLALYKKSSINGRFQPWHYLVTDSKKCEEVFGVPYKDIPFPRNSVLCKRYDRAAALETKENVTIGLEGGRGTIFDEDEKELNTVLLDWMNVTGVQLRFSGIRIFPDSLTHRWQHYVVREVEVEAYCHCHGHADGINCPYNETIKDRVCVCQEGTCGVQCGYCCPAYNQYPFKSGSLGPFATDKDAACEKCNCYNHSDVCEYNATVAAGANDCSYGNNATNDECSMDILGRYKGGGVCIGCKDNTEGINCQRCVPKFYREQGKSHWEKDACQPCDCFVNGTDNTTRNGVEYLDCVRDVKKQQSLETCNCKPRSRSAFVLTGILKGSFSLQNSPGQCLCKNKTTGRRCDLCVDGYYNLTAENPRGCLACLCTTEGTVNASINCHQDNGVCSCKPRVIGDKCSECQNGTFNLADENEYGCTVCMCSGITHNCTSSKAYRAKTKYDLQGWNLTRDFNEDDVVKTMNIQEEINGRLVDLVSSNVSTGQILHWTTKEDYFEGNSLVTSYGGYLEFTRKISFVKNGTLQTDLRIIIKGPRNVTIESSLPQLNSTTQGPEVISVKMVEFGWKQYDTNTAVDRMTFMLVLSKPEKMWISASFFTSGNESYQTSFGNLHISSVSNASTAANTMAVDVEQCSCGEAYQGTSCERCARGYHRVNVSGHPFFGQCIPCNCHGHTEDCDPDTGRCLDCQHNTTGFNCAVCRDGFYGNARNGTEDDCRKCPCEAPKTTTDLCNMLPNGSAQCLNCSKGYEKNLECNRCDLGYFGWPFLEGGNCSKCECNNNSEICDRESGSCLAYCENNSTGWHCERCENGTYGDATKQQCQGCTCDITGSYDVPCDFRTGHCHCKPHVVGFNCSRCEVNSYGFSDTGCLECHCNEFGSTNLQCNDSGICECKNHTHGDKCDACLDYYYGLPNVTCKECACNATGSNNTVCDHITGACPCKFGVEGRQCDSCKVQHKDFSDTGCERCPPCTRKLQGILDESNDLLMTTKTKADQANTSLDYYDRLSQLEKKIEGVKEMEDKHVNIIRRLEGHRNTSINATILGLEERNAKLKVEAQILDLNLTSETRRVEDIFNNSKLANDYANDVTSRTREIVDDLKKLSNESKTMNISASDTVNFMLESISDAKSQASRASNLKNAVEQTSNETESVAVDIEDSTEVIERLSKMIEQFNDDLNRTKTRIDKDKLQLKTTHDEIEAVKNLNNETSFITMNTKTALRQTSLNINNTNAFNAEGEVNYKSIRDTKLPELNQELETLKTDINNVNASYWNALPLVANASRHADKLDSEARRLERNFSEAKNHGEKADQSIKTYERTTKTIEDAKEKSIKANKDVTELMSRIQNLTSQSQSVNARASECKNASVQLLAETRKRNVEIDDMNRTISDTFKLFIDANETCNRVEVDASIFEDKRSSIIKVAASDGPFINNTLENATKNVSKTQDIRERIELEGIELRKRLSQANKTLEEIDDLVANSSKLLEKTHFTGNETAKLLANISQSVNLTKQVNDENHQREISLLRKIGNLESRLKAAKDKIAKFRLALKVKGNTSVEYKPTKRMISNPLLNSVSLDFKTSRSTGLLLYLSPNTHQSLSLKLVINRVRFTYKIDSFPVVITNWEVPIDDDVWYRVYASRYDESARLTVTNLNTSFSRTYEDPTNTKASFKNLRMEFTANSSVFLGGVPPDFSQANLTERYFDGDLDNLILNEDKVPLWEPLKVEGVRKFVAKRVSENPIKCVTFHGDGYIKQRAGVDFYTQMNSSLHFQFRSFFKNALIVLVEGGNQQFIYSVSLSDGHVIFRYNKTRLRSSNSDYNDGKWYHVAVTRTLKNASLHITPLEPGSKKGSDYVNESTSLPAYLPDAEYIYFGGSNETRERFAGDMKYVFLSSFVKNKLVARSLSDKNLTIDSTGVAFDQCLDQVEKGLRYSNGYSIVNTENITTLESLEITFKTKEPSGLLAYSVKENLHFYLALFHGNLFLVYGKSNSYNSSLQTDTETLNDGAFHTVTVEIKNSRIQMKWDTSSETLSRDLSRDEPAPLPLKNLFIAGIPSSIAIPLLVPILSSFNGDVKHVQVNGATLFDGSSLRVFTSATSVGVSASGVSPSMTVPTTEMPTNTPAPPTCGSKYPEKVHSEKQNEVHFSGIDSYLSPKVYQSLINEMAISFVISIEFRALSPNGVLFMAADNQTSQFVTLELVDGYLVYQFNTGSGLVRMRTTGTYSVGGIWYQVDLLRISHFGAMVVRQTKEYHKNDNKENGTEPLNITQVFVGGTNGYIDTSFLENREAPSFFGCIRSVVIETQVQRQSLNLSGDAVSMKHIRPGQCYDHVQPQVSFNGSGFAELDGKFNLSAQSVLSIKFRTTKRNGLLFFATSQTGDHTMAVEQVNGQMHLSYVESNNLSTLHWIDPVITSPEYVNSSYAVCDNIYHTVNVRRSNGRVEMDVDGKGPVRTNIANGELSGTVYIGGVPNVLREKARKMGPGFAGCIESVHIDRHVVDFKHGTSAENSILEFGCRGPIKPQQSYSSLNIFKVMVN